ncbi:inositol phospholipid biosynthesis protein [Emydomyces testavorans]|uniref:Acyl-coenzyme A diphosphatase SCS3 n=1 Tax=Emydomyces testavorans TaxID=2070801 RepID=A0AAF0DC11_9EURO|nr:inositol phospholipid biosynthesis protein [Emydomyces testavorans]
MTLAPEPVCGRTVCPSHSHLPAVSLVIYPATLVLASFFSLISPTARPLTPNLTSATTVPDHPPIDVNYFARKGNIFNVYFVKVGWLWTTLAFLSILLTQPGFVTRRLDPNERLRKVWQATFRYVLVTLAWILTTQWCFGPAIIDRSFTATGGRCERIRTTGVNEPISDSVMTAVACKMANGTWQGGHDVSGHVFMLVLASAFLIFELLGSGASTNDKADARVKNKDGTSTEMVKDENNQHPAARMSRIFAWAVAGLSWWMLLMTGIWFHTLLEKTSGLIIALAAVYTIYILPRTVPSWRSIVGIPGL